jgi:hypothetical protein
VVVPVPPPSVDNGVTAHLLNGTVFFQRLSIAVPTADPTAPDTSNIPYIALFQGDGYCVAGIAGFAAGTDLDAQFAALAHTPTQVEPQKPDEKPYPNLEVGDDTHSMRVVDAAGAPVDCRGGDQLYVPAEDAVVYLLQAGTAQDLGGTLMAAVPNRLPLLSIQPVQKPDALYLQIQNISARTQSGTFRLLRPPTGGQPGVTLAERDMPELAPNKETSLPIVGAISGTLVVEITTTGARPVVQRTAITLP